MKDIDIEDELEKLDNFRNDRSFVDFLHNYNFIINLEREAGLHDRNNVEFRAKWINNLRKIVSEDCPKNKVGQPIVSDVDLLNSSAYQRCRALLVVLGKWKD